MPNVLGQLPGIFELWPLSLALRSCFKSMKLTIIRGLNGPLAPQRGEELAALLSQILLKPTRTDTVRGFPQRKICAGLEGAYSTHKCQ